MSEDEYRQHLALERIGARAALDVMLREWRRQLWPEPYSDPIARENQMRRFRREMAVREYWGASIDRRLIYGGICAT